MPIPRLRSNHRRHWTLADKNIKPINPQRFQGQYYDEETGLHYNLNRYYDPQIGRYITQYPIGILSDINPYRYVGNNTIRGIDPLGLDIITIYRGTNLYSEKIIYEEIGGVLSEAARDAYLEVRAMGKSIVDAEREVMIASEYVHAKQIKEWGNFEQYMQAHSEFGRDLLEVGKRSLISFTLDAKKAKQFGDFIIEIKLLRSRAYRQTLQTSTEEEVLIIHGAK